MLDLKPILVNEWQGLKPETLLHIEIYFYLMSHGLLSVNPLPAPVEESDQEERPPEDEVSHRDDEEHLDPRHSLLLHPLDVGPDPVWRRQASFL